MGACEGDTPAALMKYAIYPCSCAFFMRFLIESLDEMSHS